MEVEKSLRSKRQNSLHFIFEPVSWRHEMRSLQQTSTCNYSMDLNTDHLNTGNIWIPKFMKLRFQMVGYSNGVADGYVYVLDRPFKYQTFYIWKQDGVHLSCIQMVGLSGIQMAFENQTIWHPTSFWPFEYQTIVWYSDPHCLLSRNSICKWERFFIPFSHDI